VVECRRAAGAGPEGDGRAHHADRRPGQLPRIGIAIRVSAEPLGESIGHRALDCRHVRGLRRPEVRVDPDGLHPPQPARRIPAELVELLGESPGFSDQDHAQDFERGLLRRLVDEAFAQLRDPHRIGSEQRRFLRGKIVEERAR